MGKKNTSKYKILFLRDKCIQCHGCEAACKSWRNVEPGVRWRTISEKWTGSYPDTMLSASSKACMHCEKPTCVEACYVGAIEKRSDGIVAVDPDICTGCRECLEACPFNVPEFGFDGKMQKCDLCDGIINPCIESPPCVLTCPVNALQFVPMD
jgi:anaerobic dimethyl sulfoxide reductase subunit B